MPPPEKARVRAALLLGYSAILAFSAGFVNAVALLILALPVGNLTAITTQLGMNTANPWLYEGHVLLAILCGFLAGATLAGAVLAPTDKLAGRRHAVVLFTEAALVLAAAGVEETFVKAQIASLGIEQTAVQAMFAAAALGLQNALTSSFRDMSVRTTLHRDHHRSRSDARPQPRTRNPSVEGRDSGNHIAAVPLWRYRRDRVRRTLRRIRPAHSAATCTAVAAANVLHSRIRSRQPVPETAEPVPA